MKDLLFIGFELLTIVKWHVKSITLFISYEVTNDVLINRSWKHYLFSKKKKKVLKTYNILLVLIISNKGKTAYILLAKHYVCKSHSIIKYWFTLIIDRNLIKS